MRYGDFIHKTINEWLKDNPNEPVIPQALVEKMLETNTRLSQEYGQKLEREEIVCRLLASDMSVEEVSLILKIRKEEIRFIEHENTKIKIPDYAKKLKARRKSRARA